MNESYMRSVIKDREREVSKYVEYNQIHRLMRDSTTNQLESSGQWKNVLSSWFLIVAKRLKGVFEISNKGDVKV
jgi:hypothetical protein